MDKVITVTGAFKNAGDYLIGHRARMLLANHVNAEIIDVNRREIGPDHYDLFNSAKAVLLTGGPAYQENIYPNVYNIDLEKIRVPVIPFGLGWKGKLNQDPEAFRFESRAGEFVKRLHSNETIFSSARDYLTVDMLAANGVNNVVMTGCPAWYDEAKLEQDYVFNPNVRRLVLSMPAVPQRQVAWLMAKLSKDFPKAEKFLSYQAGFTSTHSRNGAANSRWNKRQIIRGYAYGFKPISFESNFNGFQEFMSSVDFHIGYRVHSHIFSLSQRTTSMLIAEDSRGVGQVAAMGGVALSALDSKRVLLAAMDELFSSQGAAINLAVDTMRSTHKQMLSFLDQI